MFRKYAFVFIILCVFNLSGCYDNRETDTLATVMAVGVDLNEGGGRKYTFAVADAGGFTKESKGDAAAMTCFTQSGDTIESAVNMLDSKLSKKLSFSHLSALIFSNDAGENGMYEEISYFEKRVSVRPQTMLALTEHRCEDYLNNLNPSLESNPEKYFQNIFEESEFYVSALKICDFTNAYHGGTSVLVPVISGDIGAQELTEQEVYVAGSALVSRGRVTSKIEDNWVPGLVLSRKPVEYGSVTLSSVKSPRIYVDVKETKPVVNIKLFIRSKGKIDKKTLEKELESVLLTHASRSEDIIDIASKAKKSFLLEHSYESYNISEKLKNMSFNIDLEVTAVDI